MCEVQYANAPRPARTCRHVLARERPRSALSRMASSSISASWVFCDRSKAAPWCSRTPLGDEKRQLPGSGDDGWVYTDRAGRSKLETPGGTSYLGAYSWAAFKSTFSKELLNWIKTAVLATLCCAAASASTVYYTETIANASGVLDGTTFTGQTVTIVLTGDTSTITNPSPGIYLDLGIATVSVSSGGSDTFTDSMEAFDLQSVHEAGTVDATVFADLLDIFNSSFATYALNASIGPLSGGSAGNSGISSYATVGGSFEFTSALNIDHPASFTATVVPEPGTLGLIGSGIGLLLIRRRTAR